MPRRPGIVVVLGLATLAIAPGAQAAQRVQHLHFKYGPIKITPGQNFIKTDYGIPKPKEDGYVVSFNPNIHWAVGPGGRKVGGVPPVDVIHLHHGVWLSTGGRDATAPGLPVERFAAAGEEKTRLRFPKGYGFVFKKQSNWTLNYMIHNLTDTRRRVWVTYDIDFVPARWPEAKRIRAARPIWMDVVNGSIYPVFDVHRGTGKNGRFTFPTQAKDPYPDGRRRNEWPVDRDGTLVATAGHLHPGGLHTDLYVRRGARRAHLFRSSAHYWEPAGAVSWDVAMTATRPDWKVDVRKGDVLSTTATYDSKRASWYESMGIMVVFMADGLHGDDPFTTRVDKPGTLTHGHLPENNHHGGASLAFAPNPLKVPSGRIATRLDITNFLYQRGSFLTGGRIPTVRRGSSITFVNRDDALGTNAAWHSITVQGALQQGDRHRLSARQRAAPVRLGPARHGRAADRRPDHVGHPEDPPRGDLHVLLPDPPLHAGCVPGCHP
jgi:hypothetical protein